MRCAFIPAAIRRCLPRVGGWGRSWSWLVSCLFCSCLYLFGGLPHEAKAQPGPAREQGLPLLPAELSISAPTFPEEVLLWLEDGRAERVAPALQALILAQPDSFALRAMRVQLESLKDLDGFLSSTNDAPADTPVEEPAERFERLQRQLTRLELERKYYRGDKGEDAATFIARLEAAADELVEGFEALQVENVKGHPDPLHDPVVLLRGVRLALSRAYALQLVQRLDGMERQFLWQALQGEGDWLSWYRLTALEAQLIPELEGRTWLESTCGMPQQLADSKLSSALWARCRFLLLQSETKRLSYEEAAQRWKSSQVDFREAWLEDERRLSLARVLGRSYGRPAREEAVTVYQSLLEEPLRNTSYPAALELCQLLRRLDRFDEVVEVARRWRERAPRHPFQLEREEGRALYALERYSESLEAFKRLVEGPRGRGADYLLMVEALWPLRGTEVAEGRDLRREALQLTDFAQLAMREEALVVGWTNGQAPALRELFARLAELNALSRHATLFPAPFALGGVRVLLEVLAVALGVMGVASWPRRSKKLLKSAALVALWGVLPGAWALGALQPGGLEGVTQLGWVGQGLLRMGLLWLAGLLLGRAAGLPLLGLGRLMRWWRLAQRPAADVYARGLRSTVAGLVLVGVGVWSLELLSLRLGGPVPYLERFSASLVGVELRALSPELPLLNRLALLVTGTVLFELLCRGVLLGGSSWVSQGRVSQGSVSQGRESQGRVSQGRVSQGWRGWAVLGASAGLGAVLRLGGLEPLGVQLGVGVGIGLLLGWVRLRLGLDVSLLLAVGGALGAELCKTLM